MKRKSICLAVVFFCLFCFYVFGQSSSQYLFQENLKSINPDYSGNIGFTDAKRILYEGNIKLLEGNPISNSALAVLNDDELSALWMMIIAKQGFNVSYATGYGLFQGVSYHEYFSRFNWYKPTKTYHGIEIYGDNIYDNFPYTDAINLLNIMRYENARDHRKRNEIYSTILDLRVNKKDLTGFWATPTRGDGAGMEIAINNDDTIFANIEEEFYINWNWKGRYKIENGFLIVTVTEQYVGNPAFLKDKRWRWPNGVRYNNGTVFYNEPIKLEFPIGKLEESEYIENGRRFGSVLFSGPSKSRFYTSP